jgi:hypothetical protein
MFGKQHLDAVVISKLALKFVCLVLLAIVARQAFASCQADGASGWQIPFICSAQFDEAGNYFESRCDFVNSPPNASSANECRVTRLSNGRQGCTGSICYYYGGGSGGGGCVPSTGECDISIDCCGSDLCVDGKCGTDAESGI